MNPPKVQRIDSVEALRVVVARVGPLVPVSVAARMQGVSRQAVYGRAANRWLVDGLVMVPAGVGNLTTSQGEAGKV